ncbi:IgGFc-binding protein-like [Clarias gariepinus]|uniref:IgGFc-binding protein-like n=1 Tax=Clarias gariepinus TaxID=13013 RepID=UPI00234C7E9B|nr:IgGFc-binding protein-like [Clarias gariepinus]
MVEADGSFSLFSGETWNITSIGAYELVKACNGALEEEWFRVVVVLGSQNSVVAVYVYFEEAFITFTNKESTWINGKLLTLPQKLKNEVMVELVEDSLTIEKKGILRVSFSLSLGLKVSVSDGMTPKVCGACGSDDKIFDQPLSIQEFMAKWRALDFPNPLC